VTARACVTTGCVNDCEYKKPLAVTEAVFSYAKGYTSPYARLVYRIHVTNNTKL